MSQIYTWERKSNELLLLTLVCPSLLKVSVGLNMVRNNRCLDMANNQRLDTLQLRTMYSYSETVNTNNTALLCHDYYFIFLCKYKDTHLYFINITSSTLFEAWDQTRVYVTIWLMLLFQMNLCLHIPSSRL